MRLGTLRPPPRGMAKADYARRDFFDVLRPELAPSAAAVSWVDDLMDDVNTDAMTPAWACFDYEPARIARNAYGGITVAGERLFPEGALADGNFEVIVAGYRRAPLTWSARAC